MNDVTTFERSDTRDLRDLRGKICNSQKEFSRKLLISLGKFWRPEPESNRRTRICNPLHHHSAIGPKKYTWRLRW